MSDIFNMADTWNAGGTTFSAIKMNVTDTASAAASLLLDLQVGGVNKFAVSKLGHISKASIAAAADRVFIALTGHTGGLQYNTPAGLPCLDVSASTASPSSVGAALRGDGVLYFNGDTYFLRDAANVLAQRNSTTAQTFRTYGTYTDASNYRRVALAMTTAGVATLTAEGLGTGASGNVLHISSLPTSNPGAGILWNNAGTPAIGT